MKVLAKVWKIGHSLVVSIKKDTARHLGVKEGDEVMVSIRKVKSEGGETDGSKK
jgi:antitoxin component of MazEF toxin-antitoxin module